ncbi:hypothetical protein BDF22DRAFT_651790 [Syncephalis plumigaleata]|nr:hypothetical protein BDF22DRAFT_651790 [Syncephalis plumigaleata]
MSANNFIGHRRAGSSGGSSIGNGSNPNNGMVLDANATMRRKPRVAVSAQMEYRPRPNSMVNGYPPNANINHSATSPPQNANYPASGRPTSIILGNGPMPNSGVNNIMPRYDTHRRTPSAPRIQGVVGSLNPTSPQSPRFGSGSFPPHSPSHSPRSGSPCSPELMVNGGRLVAGGIYSAGGAYENGSELDYDGDRSAVSGIDMRTTGFQHGRTGSADMPMVRLAKTSGARVSRGNIIEIGAMSLAAAGDISDQYNSDILDDDDDGDRDEEDAEDDDEDDDEDVDDIGTKSDHELASDRDEGDHFRDDIDSDLEIDQHRDNDMTPLDSPQSRARQMLQGPFARPRAFSRQVDNPIQVNPN